MCITHLNCLFKARSATAPPPAPAPEKKFKCHRCSYAATKIASLDNHVRYVHMKEPKPFRCTYNDNCRYSAMSNGSIVSHVNRVHLKVKRFKVKSFISYVLRYTNFLFSTKISSSIFNL